MSDVVNDLLTRERRRQRAMVTSVVIGIALVAISSRSERAMFQFGIESPGVFAMLRETGPAMPRVTLREGSPAAFFAGLGRFGKPAEPGNGRVIPAESLERIGPQNALLFAGPESQLPPGNGFISDPLTPNLTHSPGMAPLPGSGDPGSRRIISNEGAGSSSGGSSGGSSSGGGSSGGGTSSSSGGMTSSGGGGGSSSGGGSSGGTPSAVPEPGTWVLMIGGFMAIGAAMRRRRKGIASLA